MMACLNFKFNAIPQPENSLPPIVEDIHRSAVMPTMLI